MTTTTSRTSSIMDRSVFNQYDAQSWPYQFIAELHLVNICGGVPSNPNVIEGWLKAHLAPSDDLIKELVAETMADRGIPMDEAVRLVAETRHLNGFRRQHEPGCDLKCHDRQEDPDNPSQCHLTIRRYQIEALLKEAKSIAANEGKLPTKGWGNPDDGRYKKGIKEWFPEHVHVTAMCPPDDTISLGVTRPSFVEQKFVHSRYGSSIEYVEIVEDVTIQFRVKTDHKFTDKEWAMIWTTAQENGLGANRSQGYGKFAVTRWDPDIPVMNGSRSRPKASSSRDDDRNHMPPVPAVRRAAPRPDPVQAGRGKQDPNLHGGLRSKK